MKKLGTYKENGMNTTYFQDGLVVSVVPSPFDINMEEFDKLPEGYKYPEAKWENDPYVSHKLVEIDFKKGTITEL
jgi:hypothetical protein